MQHVACSMLRAACCVHHVVALGAHSSSKLLTRYPYDTVTDHPYSTQTADMCMAAHALDDSSCENGAAAATDLQPVIGDDAIRRGLEDCPSKANSATCLVTGRGQVTLENNQFRSLNHKSKPRQRLAINSNPRHTRTREMLGHIQPEVHQMLAKLQVLVRHAFVQFHQAVLQAQGQIILLDAGCPHHTSDTKRHQASGAPFGTETPD